MAETRTCFSCEGTRVCGVCDGSGAIQVFEQTPEEAEAIEKGNAALTAALDLLRDHPDFESVVAERDRLREDLNAIAVNDVALAAKLRIAGTMLSEAQTERDRLREQLKVLRRVAGTLGSTANEIIALANIALGLPRDDRPQPISSAAAVAQIRGEPGERCFCHVSLGDCLMHGRAEPGGET